MNLVLLNIFTFPLWWYTKGLHIVLTYVSASWQYGLKKHAFKIFIKHMFEPMFGDYSRDGKLVGMFLRFWILILKLLLLLGRGVFLVTVVIAYLCVIPACLFGLYFQIF